MTPPPHRHESPSLAPPTMEGHYVLHDAWNIDWPAWWDLAESERLAKAERAKEWLEARLERNPQMSAVYHVVGQKADILFIHYAASPASLSRVAAGLQRSPFGRFLKPGFSWVSLIEASLLEADGQAKGRLARLGIRPEHDEYDAHLQKAVADATEHLTERINRPVPLQRYVSAYPMNKRRGEQWNWYAMTAEERREFMRGHATVGRRWTDKVQQVISGAVGLDDWEWIVDLHAEDPLDLKKLVYEMRFDPASSRFAEFGPFILGHRLDLPEFERYLLSAGTD